MAASVLLSKAGTDTVGPGVSLRIVGTHAPPARMSVQIAIEGTARVQLQGRLHKDAPWMDLGAPYAESALVFLDPVALLRAVTTHTAPQSSVSVWAAWGIF